MTTPLGEVTGMWGHLLFLPLPSAAAPPVLAAALLRAARRQPLLPLLSAPLRLSLSLGLGLGLGVYQIASR